MSYSNLKKSSVPIVNNLSYLSFAELIEHLKFVDSYRYLSTYNLKLKEFQIVAILEQFNIIDKPCYLCGLRFSYLVPEFSLPRCIYCHAKRTEYGISRMELTDRSVDDGDKIIIIWWYKEEGDLFYVHNYSSICQSNIDQLHSYAKGVNERNKGKLTRSITVSLTDDKKEAIRRIYNYKLPFHKQYTEHNSYYLIDWVDFIIKNVDYEDILHDLVENGEHDAIKGAAASKTLNLKFHQNIDPMIKAYVQKHVLFVEFSAKNNLYDTLKLILCYSYLTKRHWEENKNISKIPETEKWYSEIKTSDDYHYDESLFLWSQSIHDQKFLKFAIDNGYHDFFHSNIMKHITDMYYLRKFLDNMDPKYDSEGSSREEIITKLINQNLLTEREIATYAMALITKYHDDWEYFEVGEFFHLMLSNIQDVKLLKKLILNIENDYLANYILDRLDQKLIKEILSIRLDLYRELYRIKDKIWVLNLILNMPDDTVVEYDILIDECDLSNIEYEDQELLNKIIDTSRDKYRIEFAKEFLN